MSEMAWSWQDRQHARKRSARSARSPFCGLWRERAGGNSKDRNFQGILIRRNQEGDGAQGRAALGGMAAGRFDRMAGEQPSVPVHRHIVTTFQC